MHRTMLIGIIAITTLASIPASPAHAESTQFVMLNVFEDGQLGAIPVTPAAFSDRVVSADGLRLTIRGMDGADLVYSFNVPLVASRLTDVAEADTIGESYMSTGGLPGLFPTISPLADTGWTCHATYTHMCARTEAADTCCVWHWMKVNYESPTDTYYLSSCDEDSGCTIRDTYYHTQGSTYYVNYVCRSYTVNWWDPTDVWSRATKAAGAGQSSLVYVQSGTIRLSGSGTWGC